MQKLGALALAAVVWLGVMFVQPGSAEACGCMMTMGYGDPVVDLGMTRGRYDRAFAVFVGRVTAYGTGRAVLELQRTWKGPSEGTITIRVRGSSCDPVSFPVK